MIPPPPIYTPAQSRIVLYIVFLYIETLYLLIYIIYMENVFKKARADRLFVSSLSFVSVFMMQIKLKQRILLLKKIVISFLCGCDVSYFFIFFFFFFQIGWVSARMYEVLDGWNLASTRPSLQWQHMRHDYALLRPSAGVFSAHKE
jgi:hypothetical protein